MSDRGSASLLIFPCNGNGHEALDCLGTAWHCVAFVDDTAEKQVRGAYGLPVLSRRAFNDLPGASVLAIPGSPASYRSRRELIDGLGLDAERFAQVIHPGAHVSPRASVGRNVLIMAGVVVTSGAVIGSHVCILPNTVVHHDSLVGDWTLLGSNVTIAGGSIIGQNCYIGSGSSVKDGTRIHDNALIGIGSNVIRDVAAGARVVGNPARPVRPSSESQH